MLLLGIIAFPFGKLLDYILGGSELRDFNARDQLLGLLSQNKDDNIIEQTEKIIMEGILNLKKRLIKDVMTTLEDT
jgi:CBS domain containing-hemolysin-like protein